MKDLILNRKILMARTNDKKLTHMIMVKAFNFDINFDRMGRDVKGHIQAMVNFKKEDWIKAQKKHIKCITFEELKEGKEITPSV